MMTKFCKACKCYLPVQQFHRHPTTRDGCHTYCKDCHREKNRQHYKENRQQYIENNRRRYHRNPRRAQDEARWKNYGLTAAEYEDMLVHQQYQCAICEVSFELRKPCVDHDHETGKVRGLLCDSCNRMLGVFEGPTGQRMQQYIDGGHSSL